VWPFSFPGLVFISQAAATNFRCLRGSHATVSFLPFCSTSVLGEWLQGSTILLGLAREQFPCRARNSPYFSILAGRVFFSELSFPSHDSKHIARIRLLLKDFSFMVIFLHAKPICFFFLLSKIFPPALKSLLAARGQIFFFAQCARPAAGRILSAYFSLFWLRFSRGSNHLPVSAGYLS
jgi:hypothetical protein